MFIVAIFLAGFFRFYELGTWPPGPYRDEAYNGLDALGVLQGNHALFFPANNGREPVYIYLVAVAVALLGPTTFALRLPAAVIGTLATLPTFLLGREWFGRTAGVLAALLWALTFWPVHLGRVGLRAGLLAPVLALAFWLGTRAYREHRAGLWFVAGLVYGLTFYTYLAARLTPLLLGLLAIYLVATGRRRGLWDQGRALWFLLGVGIAVAPFVALLWRDPSLILGRAGQVSVISPSVNGGDLWGTLLEQTGRALGMFIWRGDTILRHNALLHYEAVLPWDDPAGRPVFDWLMAAPFLAGLGWCLWRWRRPAAAGLLLWQLVLLLPTILAEDAPHFLRAAGLLPGTVFFPAIGLGLLWNWERLPRALRRTVVTLLLSGSLFLTVRDYSRYAVQPDTGYLFEAAAAELARSVIEAPAGTDVFIDTRFPEGWPSVSFLLADRPVNVFRPEEGLPERPDRRSTVYAWPYGSLDFLPAAIRPPALVAVETGPLARGDLEPEPYPLYTRYTVTPGESRDGVAAVYDEWLLLRFASGKMIRPDAVRIDLGWEQKTEPIPSNDRGDRLPNVFIHVREGTETLAQYDGPLAAGHWPAAWWQPGLFIDESHTIDLPIPFDPAHHVLAIGLYWPDTGQRLPVMDARGRTIGDELVVVPDG